MIVEKKPLDFLQIYQKMSVPLKDGTDDHRKIGCILKLRTIEITIALSENLMAEVVSSHATNMKKEFNNS